MCKAYGKINIGLDITGLREDGYHLLDTVMQTVDIYDEICISKRDDSEVIIKTNLSWLPTGPENLVYKAVRALTDRGADIELIKHIPSQAGLGGGSTDCAAALRMTNELFSLNKTDDELEQIGAGLGADVPFFIRGGTRRCKGIGEIEETVSHDTINNPVLLVKPKRGVRTPDMYKAYDALDPKEIKHPDIDGITDAFAKADIKEIAAGLGNVFEPLAIRSVPVIAEIKAKMLSAGALGAQMSGSGSTVFGIFDDKESAEKCRKIFADRRDIEYTAVTRFIDNGWGKTV